MTRLLISLMFLVSVLVSPRVSAQNGGMTPYETQRGELCKNTLEKIMNSMSMYDKATFGLLLQEALKQADGDDYKATVICENIIIKVCDLGEATKTEANLLAGSIDLGDAYTGQTLQEWREIGQWYKQEREKIEATKTEEDIRREKAREEQTMPASNNMLDLAKVEIRKQYLKWATKDVYEKTVDYNNRIAEQGPSYFDSLCFAVIKTTINSEIRYRQIGEYDADNEGINVRCYYGSEEDEHSYVDAFWPMSPDIHRSLCNPDSRRSWSKYPIGVFIENGDLYPSIYHWYRFGSIMDVRLGEPDTVTISIKELLAGVDIPITEDHTFDYLSYSSGIIERDSLLQLIKDLCGKDYSVDPGGYGYHYRLKVGYNTVELPFGKEKELLYSSSKVEKILDIVKNAINEDLEKKREAEEARIRAEQEAQKAKKKKSLLSRFFPGD